MQRQLVLKSIIKKTFHIMVLAKRQKTEGEKLKVGC